MRRDLRSCRAVKVPGSEFIDDEDVDHVRWVLSDRCPASDTWLYVTRHGEKRRAPDWRSDRQIRCCWPFVYILRDDQYRIKFRLLGQCAWQQFALIVPSLPAARINRDGPRYSFRRCDNPATRHRRQRRRFPIANSWRFIARDTSLLSCSSVYRDIRDSLSFNFFWKNVIQKMKI